MKKIVSTAIKTEEANYTGVCINDIEVGGRKYGRVKFKVLDDLCVAVILGYEFQKLHKNVIFTFGGNRRQLKSYSKKCTQFLP